MSLFDSILTIYLIEQHDQTIAKDHITHLHVVAITVEDSQVGVIGIKYRSWAERVLGPGLLLGLHSRHEWQIWAPVRNQADFWMMYAAICYYLS